MGKMVNVSGFLTGVSAMKVRYLFERITGSETIHTIGLKETNHIDGWPSEGLNPLSQNEGWKKPYRNAVNAILERDTLCAFKMELERFLLRSLAKLVARKCDIKGIFPSTFQIRCGGQMISILSTLEVSDNVFEKKPKKVVDALDSFLADHMKILHVMPLREYTKFLKDLIFCGFKPSEPFLSMMLHHIRESKLAELRTKMCILIPKSRSMMGCMDETNLLEYGEVFLQCSYESKQKISVSGDVAVKSPFLHAVDICVLKAIEVTGLVLMTDCLIQTKVQRALDEDLYFVSWDPELIPLKTYEPMDYTIKEPQVLDCEITIQDYLKSHKVFVNKEDDKSLRNQCLELANMFSAAADFPKTELKVKIPPQSVCERIFRFMQK
ncbi:hypothetical protein F2Q69_00038522 [Brassica cretica]|uniref:RNA-dependent RNA polymerase n=1 Tax=Brassica cretica TaxID=69181 RepID=A0A8S9SQE5_BRACR|nr:hypothetical protein F2Q69_00038522 [Brassica cretica]